MDIKDWHTDCRILKNAVMEYSKLSKIKDSFKTIQKEYLVVPYASILNKVLNKLIDYHNE